MLRGPKQGEQHVMLALVLLLLAAVSGLAAEVVLDTTCTALRSNESSWCVLRARVACPAASC